MTIQPHSPEIAPKHRWACNVPFTNIRIGERILYARWGHDDEAQVFNFYNKNEIAEPNRALGKKEQWHRAAIVSKFVLGNKSNPAAGLGVYFPMAKKNHWNEVFLPYDKPTELHVALYPHCHAFTHSAEAEEALRYYSKLSKEYHKLLEDGLPCSAGAVQVYLQRAKLHADCLNYTAHNIAEAVLPVNIKPTRREQLFHGAKP